MLAHGLRASSHYSIHRSSANAVILTELLAKVLLSRIFELIAIDYIATLSALFLRMAISHMQAKSL